MDSIVRVPDRRIQTNFEISNKKRSLSFESNDPGPSLSGLIWLVLPPTRKKIRPALLHIVQIEKNNFKTFVKNNKKTQES